MKILRRILFSSIALGWSVLNLTACGQTGPLYLPAKPASSTQSHS